MRVALLVTAMSGCAVDPASVFASRREARSLDCTRTTQAEASARQPGLVPEPAARGANFSITDAMVCERNMLDGDERPPRDEAILSTLTASMGELLRSASLEATARDTLWHVDAFYPDARVASKIAVAARVALVEQGRLVSDRVPLLAAGDVAVVNRQRVEQRFPMACHRLFTEQTLQAPQVFLALMIIDPRESQLHAGLCSGGQWKWLQ